MWQQIDIDVPSSGIRSSPMPSRGIRAWSCGVSFGKISPSGDLRPLILGRRSARAEGVTSGVRFVRTARSASIKQSTSERQTSIYDQSIWGACLLGSASCEIGADRHRRMTAVSALDPFETLLWELTSSCQSWM
jgi:hypothetical protein